MQQVNLPIDSVVDIYAENLTAFFKKRDCTLSSMLFKGVLKLCWEGNWQLASLLVSCFECTRCIVLRTSLSFIVNYCVCVFFARDQVDFAFDSSIRYFRRSQALELLIIFYNNNRLLNMDCDQKYVDVRIKLETVLCKNTVDVLRELCELHASENGQPALCNGTGIERKILQKFITHLFTLLRIVRAHHLEQAWDWQTVKEMLTTYRSQNNLSKDAKTAYSKLAAQVGAPDCW